jgi:glucosamine--fructose-6-phosphate aminotransferase (isomerizing)
MCGIVAYIGHRTATPILMEGLKRLEYRGYDSAGIAVLDDDAIQLAKAAGRVRVLEEMLEQRPLFKGSLGIAHTRWATHGEPNDVNAHPHTEQTEQPRFALIHNGIIENYATLKTYLRERGHTFSSDTDTEVLTHLIAELYDGDLELAVQAALREVTGAYAIAVMCADEPDALVVARKGSPLMVGVGKDEYIVASDSSAIVSHTTQAITLDDYTVAKLTRNSFRTTTVDNIPITPQVQELEFGLEQIELGGYEHFMLKEICEQPDALRLCLKGRIDPREGQVVLGGVSQFARDLVKAKRIIFVGQGTALHAAMIAEYVMEDLAKIPTEVEFASEFRYRNPIVEDGTVVIAISPVRRDGRHATRPCARRRTAARWAWAS